MANFLEKEFKNRLTTLINESFKNEQELVELSQKLNVTRATINRWRNQSLTPKVEKLAQLASITRTSLDYIVFGKNLNKYTKDLTFNKNTYINKIIENIEQHFQSKLEASRKLKISDLTIRTWKQSKAHPSIKSIAKISLYCNFLLDDIFFN